MKRTLISLVLTLVLLCTSLSVCAESFVMAGYDGPSSIRTWEDNLFFERMEEATGISFTFRQYNDRAQWDAAKAALFSGQEELPDVLFKATLTDEELIRGLDSGILIDLAPLLPQYAPNAWKALQEHPDWLAAVTLLDGRIGALPSLTGMSTQNAIWINEKWLEKLGLEKPTDLESLRSVLTAFRDQDPNGNSKKDEIPMSFLGPWELKFFSHVYGIAVNDFNLYQDDSGELHYWPMEDSFFELASVLKAFYRDGLLDASGFSTADTLRSISDPKADSIYGAFFAPSPLNLVPAEMGKEFGILLPLSYEGKQVYRDMQQDCVTGAFAITSVCKDPGSLLGWVDRLYTEEGAIDAMVGKEGEYWLLDENENTWTYISEISSSDLSMLSVYDSGNLPWLFPKDFYIRYADPELGRLCESLDELRPFLRTPTERVIFQGEDRQKLIALQNDLGTFVDVTFARWILGDEEMTDESLASFRQGLKDRGVDELLNLWNDRLNH